MLVFDIVVVVVDREDLESVNCASVRPGDGAFNEEVVADNRVPRLVIILVLRVVGKMAVVTECAAKENIVIKAAPYARIDPQRATNEYVIT